MSNLNQAEFSELKKLVMDRDHQIILLKGPAGSGKTTMLKYLIQWLDEEEVAPYELMASTGRAAKILSNKTNGQATTVHSKIYHFAGVEGEDQDLEFNDDGSMKESETRLIFSLASNVDDPEDIVYVIDEASMISDQDVSGVSFSVFGSGRLLSDLLSFASGRKILFVGDEFQLPPVSTEAISPALHAGYLRAKHNLKVVEVNLNVIHRFRTDGFIYHMSNYYRNKIANPNYSDVAKPRFSDDINIYSGFNNFFKSYIAHIRTGDYRRATFITPSNNMAGKLNIAARETLYPSQPKVQTGDLLLVTQNSHKYNLYNGDLVIVKRISKRIATGSLNFLQLQLEELIGGAERDVLLIEDLLYDGKPNLDKKQHQRLLIDFSYRCKARNIKAKSPRFYAAMIDDPYLNAVRAKFGYAMTCHKAQGGEWEHIFIRLFPFMEKWEHPKSEQWKYTALTRATSQIHLIRGSLNVTVSAPF